MTTPLPKRFEPFLVPGGLRGQLTQLPLPDILQHLRLTKLRRGAPSPGLGGARTALYLKGGGWSSPPATPQRPVGEILIREGKITVEEYEASMKAITKGSGRGRCSSRWAPSAPRTSGRGCRPRSGRSSSASSCGRRGSSISKESTLPDKERITVDLDVSVPDPGGRAAGRRRRGGGATLSEGSLVPEAVAAPPAGLSSPSNPTSSASSTGSAASSRSARQRDRGQRDAQGALRPHELGIVRIKGKRSGHSTRTSFRRHALLRDGLLHPEVQLRLPAHGAEGRPHRGECAGEVPRRPPEAREDVSTGMQAPEGRLARLQPRRARPQQLPEEERRGASWTGSTSCSSPAPRREAHAGGGDETAIVKAFRDS